MSDAKPRVLLEAEHLPVRFPVRSGLLIDRTVAEVHAVEDVTLELLQGETLGVVGESGCGKTTLSRCLVRLLKPTAGTLRFKGKDITTSSGKSLREVRRQVQMVFQDPQSSLTPRQRVGQIVGRPLRLRGEEGRAVSRRTRELLDRVGLNPEHVNRFPHEFSGGQRQRIGIARAGDGAEPDAARRAGVRARRLDPGPGHQPARRSAGRVRDRGGDEGVDEGARQPARVGRHAARAAPRR